MDAGTVHQLLINPKYIRANIYNRRSFKLKHKRVENSLRCGSGEMEHSSRS